MIPAYNKGMVDRFRSACRRTFTLLSAGVLIGAGLGLSLPMNVEAAELDQRSLHITSATPSIVTTHRFVFSYATLGTAVGSVVFEYCTSPLPALPCDEPPGIDASNAVLANQDGEIGFSILPPDSGRIILERATAALPSAGFGEYTFDTVRNPSGAPDTFYVRITTYESTDGTGVPIDFGAVVNSTTQGVGLTTEVPPILNFCVGVSIPGDCSTADGSFIDLGTLSPKLTSSGTSQMMVGTNAYYGVSIVAHGTTMTSGNNIIPALGTPTVAAPGNSQFGLNLRSNSSPAVGQEPSGVGIVSPTSRYGSSNQFAFTSGDIVASSANVTNIRKLTVSYVVNVSPVQTPGVYTATLTYICTASF